MFFKKKVIKFISILLFVSVILFSYGTRVKAQTQQERLSALEKQIQEYETEIKRLTEQANTLSNQISQYNAQIRLTTLKINQTEEKISLLANRINQLQISLDALYKAYVQRVNETYKITRLSQTHLMILSSSSLSSIFSSYHYLQKIQEADKELLERLETAQTNYGQEKKEQEDLQKQLENQKQSLNSQKSAKSQLLIDTQNNEKKYQELLQASKAEFEAIQAITAGRGVEEFVRNVSQGEKIASIIQGSSCNSSGSHLHFMVRQNSSTVNPFNFLKSGISFENCSGSSCGSSDGDSFNPGGSWEWPVDPTVKYTQGYGSTWAVRNTWVGRIYGFHNGIDITSSSSSIVKSVTAGKLYQGSYSGYNGCKLRYVRVEHSGSDFDTFYLHINY